MKRWSEELVLIRYEMQWTVRYFDHQSQKWQSASTNVNTAPGALAYAHRQHGQWQELALWADKAFRSTNLEYISPFGQT
jgi:hypothetical protein